MAAAITGVILAGGRARRMAGEDKGLVELNGQPMIRYIMDIVGPQVDDMVINANRNHDRYAQYGHPVIADTLDDFQGPLAGMFSAMSHVETPLIMTVPCDGPLLPADLAMRLRAALSDNDADIAVAHDGQRMQPVFALLKCSLLDSLKTFLQEGERKIDRWYARHNMALADFASDQTMFLNVNTPEERDALAEQMRQKT